MKISLILQVICTLVVMVLTYYVMFLNDDSLACSVSSILRWWNLLGS